jgi:hypothetical protein
MSELSKEEWNSYFSSHWTFNGAKQDGHIAMFPEELPVRLIKMFSFVGETVFDPFMGSGTTALAAKKLLRHSIGYEINPDFIHVYKSKLDINQPDMFGTEYIVRTDSSAVAAEEMIVQLPYVFYDPHRLDKKMDVKRQNYGSKIDKDSREREEYFTLKRIISPCLIELSSDTQIRLIGIKEITSLREEAMRFLAEKLVGQKVFLKYDNQIQYDGNNNRMCYLYLKNRTFINAHLLRAGLAEVDNSWDFKYKSKFQSI